MQITPPNRRSRQAISLRCVGRIARSPYARSACMRGTVLHGAREIRCEEVAEPKILEPTDAIIKLSASCICGSDLWPYRGIQEFDRPMHMGHEYCGIVVE